MDFEQPETHVLNDELLAKIRKKCGDAQFGYDSVTGRDYFVHVSVLLREREALLKRVAGLERATEANRDDGR
jgi:hypothetical protein